MFPTLAQLQTLIDMKLDFYRDEDLRDEFIDKLMVHYPELAVQVFESVKFKNPLPSEHGGEMNIEYNGRMYNVYKNDYATVEQYGRARQLVDAIKQLRSITGMGLKEAKDYCEQKWWPERLNKA